MISLLEKGANYIARAESPLKRFFEQRKIQKEIQNLEEQLSGAEQIMLRLEGMALYKKIGSEAVENEAQSEFLELLRSATLEEIEKKLESVKLHRNSILKRLRQLKPDAQENQNAPSE